VTDDAPELLIEYTSVCAVCPEACRVISTRTVEPACPYPTLAVGLPAWEVESESYL